MKLLLLPLGSCIKTQLFLLLEFFFYMYSRSIIPPSSPFRTLLCTPLSLTIRLVPFWKANVYWAPTVCKASLSEWMATRRVAALCWMGLHESESQRRSSPRSDIQRKVGLSSQVSEIHKAVTVLGNVYLCLGFCIRGITNAWQYQVSRGEQWGAQLTRQWAHAKQMTWFLTNEGLILLPFAAGCRLRQEASEPVLGLFLPVCKG